VSARTPNNAKLQVKEMRAQKLSLISIVTCINDRRACVNILQTKAESCGLMDNMLLNMWIALSLGNLMVFSVFFPQSILANFGTLPQNEQELINYSSFTVILPV